LNFKTYNLDNYLHYGFCLFYLKYVLFCPHYQSEHLKFQWRILIFLFPGGKHIFYEANFSSDGYFFSCFFLSCRSANLLRDKGMAIRSQQSLRKFFKCNENHEGAKNFSFLFYFMLILYFR